MAEAVGIVHMCGKVLLVGPELIFDEMAEPILEVMDTTSYSSKLRKVYKIIMGT